MPAVARRDRPLALFLPGIATFLSINCERAIPLTELFDIIVCDLPGHGDSGQVDDVSLEAFAGEYAALIDRYVAAPRRVSVIGESFGGLIGAALARRCPDRVGHVMLLETPFRLTTPPFAALLTNYWRRFSLSAYLRRIFVEIFNFDPSDGDLRNTVDIHSMLAGLLTDCVVLAGSLEFVIGGPAGEWRPSSQLTDLDLTVLRTFERVTVLPRIESAGHCLLLDDPRACVAALARHLTNQT